MVTDTESLTRDEVQLHTGTDPAKHAHYVRIMAAILGGPCEALCGYVWTPTRSPQGLPVCPACKAVYDDDLAMEFAGPAGRSL